MVWLGREMIEILTAVMPSYYQNIFNTLPVPILLVDARGVIVDLNPQYLTCVVNGRYTHDELHGENILNSSHMFQAGLFSAYLSLINDEKKKSCRACLESAASNALLYFDIETVSVELSDNQVGTMFVHLDVTDDVVSRMALEKNQMLRDEIQEVSGLGSWDLHVPSGKAVWSREEYRLLGYDPDKDEATADNFIARIHEEDRDRVVRALSQPFIDKNIYQADFRLQLPDGSIRHVSERGRVVFDADGKAERFLGTTLDATHRYEADMKLAASEGELSQILENMQDTYYRTDSEGRVVRASSSVYDLLGYQPEEVLGLKIIDLYVDPNDRQRLIQQLEETGGRVHAFEAKLRRKDGQVIWVSTNAHYFINDGEVQGIEGTTRDITRLKNTEEELQRHKKHLEHLVAERTQELESFSYSVSHDLRSPLRSINGFGLMLEEDYSDVLDETGKDYLRRVRSATPHMATLIDDLLQLSTVNRRALVLKNVRLDAVVKEIFSDLEQAHPERHVETIVAPDVLVQGDDGLLTIAMRNLLENAWKYTGKMDKARIEFGVVDKSMVDKPANGTTVYFVRDNGVGLEMKYASKLFAPFQRLHKSDDFEGTGIGLAIVNRVLVRHGGRVWVESEPGQGATFYFTVLPNIKYL